MIAAVRASQFAWRRAVTQVTAEPSWNALLKKADFEGRFPMAMFWVSIALSVLGFAALMFAIQ